MQSILGGAGLVQSSRSLIWLGKAGRKHFFFEKKKQKTFILLVRIFPQYAPQKAKVFWFFFSTPGQSAAFRHA
jgi:hypothetical protein